MKRFFTLLFALTAFIGFSNATIYLVENGNGGNSWRTAGTSETNVNLSTEGKSLTEWLGGKSFSSGDEVWVARGTYDVATQYSIVPNLKAVYGGFAGTETATDGRSQGTNNWDFTNKTIIDGTSMPSGSIIFNSGDDRPIIIDGLTFTNCPSTTNSIIYQRGATVRNCQFVSNACTAIRMYSASTIESTVQDCYFYDNSTNTNTNLGTCISGNTASTYNILGCMFDSNKNTLNSSSPAAGIRTQGNGTLNVSECTFKGNSGVVNASALYSKVVTNNITDCTFESNTGAAPVININDVAATSSTITGCTFLNNASTTTSNASIINITNANIKIEKSTFDGNTGSIPAVRCAAGTINACTFKNNTATAGNASAVDLNGGSLENCLFHNNLSLNALRVVSGKLTNCTFAENGAGDVYVHSNSLSATSIIRNSVFWASASTSTANSIYVSGSGTADIDYCVYVTSNGSFGSNCQIVSRADGASLFKDPSNDDYSLSSSSSALYNKGSLSAMPSTDILGNARTTADIGAYAYKASSGVSSSTNNDNKQVVKREYFNLTGAAIGGSIVNSPKGLYIEKNTYDDGSASSRKVLKK